ncbi:hypothetical protein ACIRF8_00060 [Streptomyces sp. NPDC102406]|uniref:hypothetical protein n=1 Tax=Streptomyces sp. NPDC102406 TaxID=3366171 RepID=UPI00380E82FA
MNTPRIVAATVAVLTLGATTAAVLDDGAPHSAAGPLAAASATLALVAGATGLALLRTTKDSSYDRHDNDRYDRYDRYDD